MNTTIIILCVICIALGITAEIGRLKNNKLKSRLTSELMEKIRLSSVSDQLKTELNISARKKEELGNQIITLQNEKAEFERKFELIKEELLDLHRQKTELMRTVDESKFVIEENEKSLSECHDIIADLRERLNKQITENCALVSFG